MTWIKDSRACSAAIVLATESLTRYKDSHYLLANICRGKDMLDYETLDAIADAYTPLLALGGLVLLLHPLLKRQWQVLGTRMTRLAAGMLVAYGLMFLDNRLQIWPAVGMDYSTHTAVALVLVMFISAHAPKTRWPCWVSLLAYALLMLYQRYHTVPDIVTTAAVVGMFYLPVIFPFHRKRRHVM
jgi:hypothetical protein